MKCEEIQELLSLRQDIKISSENESKITEHLAVCEGCRSEDRSLSQVWALLKSWEPIQPSSDFKARFWLILREDEKEGWSDFWEQFMFEVRPVFALVSIILVAVFGIVVALKILPVNDYSSEKSPVIQWAQETPDNFKTGGFLL